jgi:hypothetical protein
MNRLSSGAGALALALALALLGTACSDGLIQPLDEESPMTARIDGAPFVAGLATVSRNNGRVNVNAAGASQRGIAFTFPDDGVGTYTIGVGQLVSVGVTIGTNQSWIAGASNGTGSIEVTTLADGRIVGTFSFWVVATGEETPNPLSITEGRFDIEY